MIVQIAKKAAYYGEAILTLTGSKKYVEFILIATVVGMGAKILFGVHH